jgi:hypothetical protein
MVREQIVDPPRLLQSGAGARVTRHKSLDFGARVVRPAFKFAAVHIKHSLQLV